MRPGQIGSDQIKSNNENQIRSNPIREEKRRAFVKTEHFRIGQREGELEVYRSRGRT
jgi:hypothetical protein